MMQTTPTPTLIHNGYPAKLDTAQVAKILGFQDGDIRVLIAEGELKPLGNPVPNAIKFFALCDIEPLCADRDWLNRATRKVYRYWSQKNARKKSAHDDESSELAA